MRTLYLVAGARPNFMKIAPLARALRANGANLGFKIVHTGQHYDHELNEVFFDELNIPPPDVSLAAGSGSHAQQTAKIMVSFEEFCQTRRPDCVLVVGDVNSTLACSIVAKKLCIPVAHVEAGLRSGDMSMPEEVNRIVTDAISDFLFVTEPSGVQNLLNEGKPAARIHHVGHVMVDNLLYQRDKLAVADTLVFESSRLQEETTTLCVPCITVRENTERPITVEQGTNVVAGTDPDKVRSEVFKILDGRAKPGQRPDLWDGKASERIVAILARDLA